MESNHNGAIPKPQIPIILKHQIPKVSFFGRRQIIDFYGPDMGLNQTPNYPNLDQPQIEVEQILYRHPYNQIFVYARVNAQNIPGLSANARGSIPQICVRTTCHCSFTPHASQEEERCRYEGCWRLKGHHTKMAWSHYKIESLHGVIFTLPTNKMLNF